MWPLAAILGAAIGGGVLLCVTGILIAVKIERHRNNQILQKHGLSRGLSKYHRTKLSATENNYSHVETPNAILRRSVHTTHDNVWPANDVLGQHSSGKQDIGIIEPARRKSKRNTERSPNGTTLEVPKSRRQKRMGKSIRIDRMRHSPLSVISESTHSRVFTSPTVIAELSGDSMKSRTPTGFEIHEDEHPSSKRTLEQARYQESIPAPAEIASKGAKPGIIRRIGGVQQLGSLESCRVNGQISENTSFSTAPVTALSLLPSVEFKGHGDIEMQRTGSNASIDVVDISGLATTTVNSLVDYPEKTSSSFSGFDFGLNQKPSSPILKVPAAAKQISQRLHPGNPRIQSLHPSLEVDAPRRAIAKHDRQRHPPLEIQTHDQVHETLTSNPWADIFVSKDRKFRGSGPSTQRHSMLEASEMLDWRIVSAPLTADKTTSSPWRAFPQRPASIATTNPVKWDRNESVAVRQFHHPFLHAHEGTTSQPMAWRLSDHSSSVSRLHANNDSTTRHELCANETQVIGSDRKQLKASQFTATLTNSATVTELYSTDSATSRARSISPSVRDSASIAAFHSPQVQTCSEASGTPRPDSDIFSTAYVTISKAGEHYTAYSPRRWPLSSEHSDAGHAATTTTTPPSSSHRSTRFESPMLPSPPVHHANSQHSRKPSVQGFRDLRTSDRAAMSTGSPVQGTQGSCYRISKERNTGDRDKAPRPNRGPRNGIGERDLFDVATGSAHEITFLGIAHPKIERNRFLTPPVNKRISGLQSSSCNSSMRTISPSLLARNRSATTSNSPVRTTTQQPDYLRTSQHQAPHRPQQAVPHHFSTSTAVSATSFSGISIWEDVSVRDSPDLDIVPTPPPLRITPRPTTRTSPHDSPGDSLSVRKQRQRQPGHMHHHTHQHPYHNQHAKQPEPRTTRQHQQRLPKQPSRKRPSELDDMGNSILVQRLERAVSNGQWEDGGGFSKCYDDTTFAAGGGGAGGGGCIGGSEGSVISRPKRAEIGLGLSIGNARLGNPDMSRQPVVLID